MFPMVSLETKISANKNETIPSKYIDAIWDSKNSLYFVNEISNIETGIITLAANAAGIGSNTIPAL